MVQMVPLSIYVCVFLWGFGVIWRDCNKKHVGKIAQFFHDQSKPNNLEIIALGEILHCGDSGINIRFVVLQTVYFHQK